MKSIVLAAGTEHVPYGDLAHLIADALWPDAGEIDERWDYGFARVNLDGELKQAVRTGVLPVKDPLTFGPHTFPMGAALNSALVTIAGLREFVADRGLQVLFQFAIEEDGGTTSFNATQAQYDVMVAERKAKREARQVLGHYTMYEAAQVLSPVNGRDAKAFLVERMVPAVDTGALMVLSSVDGGPVTGRQCRPYDDWATPAHINEWLTRAKFVYRWPIVATAPHAASAHAGAPAETKEERDARYLAWLAEEARNKKRGALQRVYEREKQQNPKADRGNIGKAIKRAQATAGTSRQADAIWGGLKTVKDGKRQN